MGFVSFCVGLVVGICFVFFVRDCGIRTAGEALFCYSLKKYPKKAATTATPLQKDAGVSIYVHPFSCCARTRKRRSDMLAQKAHDNGCT